MNSRFILFDALACLYRSFYAIKQLSTRAGVPTNAVYGFIRLVQQIMSQRQPGYICVAFDGGLPKERLELHEGYKAQRPPMPEALRSQLPLVEEFLCVSGIKWLRREGAEADDIIATLAGKFRDKVDEILVVTSDKDAFQLVDLKTKIMNPAGSHEIWDADWVKNKTGVSPSGIVDWLSLVGDSSDNIPGVPGIGTKTAADLLGRFASLEGIYEHISEISSQRIRTSLEASRDIALRNRKLVKLQDGLDLQVDLDGLMPGPQDTGRLMALYEKLEFKSLLEKLRNSEFLFK